MPSCAVACKSVRFNVMFFMDPHFALTRTVFRFEIFQILHERERDGDGRVWCFSCLQNLTRKISPYYYCHSCRTPYKKYKCGSYCRLSGDKATQNRFGFQLFFAINNSLLYIAFINTFLNCFSKAKHFYKLRIFRKMITNNDAAAPKCIKYLIIIYGNIPLSPLLFKLYSSSKLP